MASVAQAGVGANLQPRARGVPPRHETANVLLDTEGNLEVFDFELMKLPDLVRDDRRLHTACGT